MYLFHKITSSLRSLLIVLVLGLASSSSLVGIAHASGQMDMMNDCARICLLQQSPVAVAPEPQELENRDDEAELQKPLPITSPYYAQFQRLFTPRKLTAADPLLFSTFRPPDIVLKHGALRF